MEEALKEEDDACTLPRVSFWGKRIIPPDIYRQIWRLLEAKIPRPKAVTMLTIRPEKLSRSTKFYALKARRFRSFWSQDSKFLWPKWTQICRNCRNYLMNLWTYCFSIPFTVFIKSPFILMFDKDSKLTNFYQSFSTFSTLLLVWVIKDLRQLF